MTGAASPTRLVWIEAALIGLLACNTVYYIVAGRASEALESVAWYALLILFLLETTRQQTRAKNIVLKLNHSLRLIATLAIAWSAALYVREREWLDAVNVALWVAVVILMELEVRRPATVAARRQAYAAAATLLYAALGVLVVIWLARGEWMDAWDAALWLAAFGALETDLLRRSESRNIV